MENFVIHENIERYRRMLEQACDEGTRRTIMDLLKEEQAKLRQHGTLDGGHSG